MVKCKVCGRLVTILFDGRCTGCMSIESIEVGQAEMEFIYSLLETPLKDGELMQMFRENKIFETEDTPKQERKDNVSFVINSINKTNPDANLYKTPITALYNKYKEELESGKYKIDLLRNYGVMVGGQVVETKAGIVVYKKPDYYDDDEVDDAIDYEDGEE